jgi:hypothetical protein
MININNNNLEKMILQGYEILFERFLDGINLMPKPLRPTRIKVEIQGPYSLEIDSKMVSDKPKYQN